MSMPPTSPRLPSPPPPAEIQIGPKSPSMGANGNHQAQQMEQTAIDANAKRRIHPGTKASKMAAGPPLVPLNELDSAFQLQEHLAALHYHHTDSNTRPVSRDAARILAAPPAGTDKTLWLYELCRFLTAQCNNLIVGFLFDTPPCSAATCPEMRASEWQFLCAVHEAPKSCCAIDYCCHTLDWAANVVTNAKIFPSRFVVDAHDKNTALKNLVNVFRRLHRIFAHAWFQHRGVFWSVEGQTGLYLFFKTVCDIYDLLSAENYKLPPEAEGLEAVPSGTADASESKTHAQPTAIAKRDATNRGPEFDDLKRTNTRRHIKSSPSTGSAVTTVLEADEDDSSGVTGKLRDMHIAAPEIVEEEETESADVPVIVDSSMLDKPPLRPSSVVPRSPEPESTRHQAPAKPIADATVPLVFGSTLGQQADIVKENTIPQIPTAASEFESPEPSSKTVPDPTWTILPDPAKAIQEYILPEEPKVENPSVLGSSDGRVEPASTEITEPREIQQDAIPKEAKPEAGEAPKDEAPPSSTAPTVTVEETKESEPEPVKPAKEKEVVEKKPEEKKPDQD